MMVGMRRGLMLFMAIALLFSGACGAGDGDDADQAVGDESLLPDRSGDDAEGGDGTTTDGETPDGGGPAATTGKAGRSASAAGPGATAPKGTVGAEPGVYRYTRKGDSSVSGAYEATKPIDTDYSATVNPPQGQEQRATYIGSSPEKEAVYRFSAAGAEFTFVKYAYGNKMRDFKPSPPAAVAPTPATAGRTWSWTMTSTDGTSTVTGTGKVLRTERIKAGGEQVDTAVYELVIEHKTPELTKTEKKTIWWSHRHGLMVKQHDVIDTDQSGFQVHAEATTNIVSLDGN